MKRLLLLMALFMSTAAASGWAEIKYTASSLRDPFARQIEAPTKTPEDEPNVIEKKLLLLAVQGIVASPTNPRAIINGKIYRIGGEPMPGVKITKIVTNGVYVSTGQQEILLSRKTLPTSKGKMTDDPSKKLF